MAGASGSPAARPAGGVKPGLWLFRFEAALHLLLALTLVHVVPMRFWRRTLGQAQGSTEALRGLSEPERARARGVARTVSFMADRLPVSLVCLPRSMAMQWMLRRRRIPSVLVFGVGLTHKDDGKRPLHAWIEVEAQELPPAESAALYARGLQLVNAA